MPNIAVFNRLKNYVQSRFGDDPDWPLSAEYRRALRLVRGDKGDGAAAKTALFDYRERVRLERLNGAPPLVGPKEDK